MSRDNRVSLLPWQCGPYFEVIPFGYLVSLECHSHYKVCAYICFCSNRTISIYEGDCLQNRYFNRHILIGTRAT